MIQATFYHDHGRIASFKMTGHADFSDYGSDIVCAAASALAISTVNGLQRVASITPEVVSDDVNGGLLEVNVPVLGSDADEKGQIILETFQDGLADVAMNYESFLKVSIQ